MTDGNGTMHVNGGAVASGHPVTRDAAAGALAAGGNAFDAAAAALWAAFVAEPLLASPGGGGFLTARPAGEAPRVYDFFTHTPRRRLAPEAVEFREIHADFGPASQAFHIGLGSAAVPGAVAGLFAFHSELGRMSMPELAAPAVEAARTGVRVTSMQAYVIRVLMPILDATDGIRAVFRRDGRFLAEGDLQRQPELGAFLEALAHEGPDLLYRGEFAARVERACRSGGGHLLREDFERYRVERRDPLEAAYREHRIWTNPPPASGGLLVAFGAQALAALPPPPDPFGAAEAVRIATALAAMREARLREGLEEGVDDAAADRVLDPAAVARYLAEVAGHPPAPRGTTHVSVIDREGGAAALSVSNGEGCGWVVPGTGVMLNNMLGEEDLQPRGFGRWPPDTRLTSMMAPTLVEDRDGSRLVALGSGGSNRIRSALLQVLAGLLDHGLPLDAAVARPRLHVEGSHLEVEGGFGAEAVEALARAWPERRTWPERNLFFGGVHAVERGPEGMRGAGDPRRGGVAAVL